jgi:hypothetical protein
LQQEGITSFRGQRVNRWIHGAPGLQHMNLTATPRARPSASRRAPTPTRPPRCPRVPPTRGSDGEEARERAVGWRSSRLGGVHGRQPAADHGLQSVEDETLQRRRDGPSSCWPTAELSTAPSQWPSATLPRARRLLAAQSSPPRRGATSPARHATGRPQRSSRLLARTGGDEADGRDGRRRRCSRAGATGGPPNLHDERGGAGASYAQAPARAVRATWSSTTGKKPPSPPMPSGARVRDVDRFGEEGGEAHPAPGRSPRRRGCILRPVLSGRTPSLCV